MRNRLNDWSSGRSEVGGRALAAATLIARASLGVTFLSAVADRFGWWGPRGTANVAWGGFADFTGYVRALTPYLSPMSTDVAAWGSTIVEIVLGLTLLMGFWLRATSVASAVTLVVFAFSMAVFAGMEAPLNASVYTAAAAALLLASTPRTSWVFSVDALAGRRRARGVETQ